MKILVTGAGGYLGTGIVRQLCDDGHEVVASCRRANNRIDSRSRIVVGDIFSMEDPYHTLNEPEVLLHLAWEKGFVHNDSAHIDNIPKHFAFVNSMISSGIKRVAVMGTMHEVGFFEGSIKEDTPTNPRSLYGIAKNTLREAVSILCNEAFVSYQWLRGYYIVGNAEYGSSVFSKIVRAVNAGEKSFPFTSGQNQWDFLDYDDFCRITARVVEQDTVDGIINICSGRPEKLSDRVERFITENNYNIKLDYGRFPDRPYDSKAVWGDDKKIKMIIDSDQ